MAAGSINAIARRARDVSLEGVTTGTKSRVVAIPFATTMAHHEAVSTEVAKRHDPAHQVTLTMLKYADPSGSILPHVVAKTDPT